MPYQIVCDGRLVDLDNVQYLLSPQDLAAYDLIPHLIELGVASLKIEGRLKTAEYVANITRHYRMAIDAAWAGQPGRVHAPRRPGDAALVLARLLARLPGRQQPQGPGAGRLRQEARHLARRRRSRSRGTGVRSSPRQPRSSPATAWSSTATSRPAGPSKEAASTKSSPRRRRSRDGADPAIRTSARRAASSCGSGEAIST